MLRRSEVVLGNRMFCSCPKGQELSKCRVFHRELLAPGYSFAPDIEMPHKLADKVFLAIASRSAAIRGCLLVCYACLGVVVLALGAGEDRKVVVPFDFVSKFDDGRYGQMVGDMLWKKLSREKKIVVPETMGDVRDYCENHNLKPSLDMDMAEMKKIVRGDFDAHIGIWGSVERAPGEENEIYDIAIKCVDFSVEPDPKVIYEVKARTKAVSEIPHLYVKNMLDALCERTPGGKAAADPIAEENWKKRPNLVVGDFQRGAGGVPRGWEKVCGQQREAFGRLVSWVDEEGNPGNKVIRFTLDRNVAENEGLMYYSEYFPVEEGATYRFQCRWRSKGPSVKAFIKCYDEEGTDYQSDKEKRSKSISKSRSGNERQAKYAQRREVYRSQENLSREPVNTWTWATHTEDFTPRHVKYSPKWGRIMLYAYMVPGLVEFDDVVIKQIVPPPKNQTPKVRRHSTDTDITIKEMEENERRSREMKAKQKAKDSEEKED